MERMQSDAIEQVIKQAIVGEQDSYDMYNTAADLVKASESKSMLQELAGQELTHKRHLETLLAKGITAQVAEGKFRTVTDLKMGDHLVSIPLAADADLQSVLIVAIQREKQSHELYSTMAGISADDTVRNLFEFLSNEELAHKRKIETLYEDVVYNQF